MAFVGISCIWFVDRPIRLSETALENISGGITYAASSTAHLKPWVPLDGRVQYRLDLIETHE